MRELRKTNISAAVYNDFRNTLLPYTSQRCYCLSQLAVLHSGTALCTKASERCQFLVPDSNQILANSALPVGVLSRNDSRSSIQIYRHVFSAVSYTCGPDSSVSIVNSSGGLRSGDRSSTTRRTKSFFSLFRNTQPPSQWILEAVSSV